MLWLRKKSYFRNSGKFRLNANGNKLDVWLIYQCEKCKHTFNLTIYERKKPSSIPPEEYKGFINNDEKLAKAYGTNLHVFKQNHAEVNIQNMNYQFLKLHQEIGQDSCDDQIMILIHNPCCLKIRPEKQISQVLGVSASYAKKLLACEEIKIESTSPQLISVNVNNYIWKEILFTESSN